MSHRFQSCQRFLGFVLLLGMAGLALAREPEACREVRLSDVGWTDITATTAITSHLLTGLGYSPRTQLLSISVTLASLKNGQVDVFLGDWQPSLLAERAPYLADGSLEVAATNLTGARFTLAVPQYVADAGVTDFADLARFADRFHRKIYGIEPGNASNVALVQLIREGHLGLDGWTVVESSEQGMLSEVDRAVRKKDWIVFLGWTPHPMNLKYRLAFLSGGDEVFGPDYGGATVYTDVRAGYRHECPNVGRLLANLRFDTTMESDIMAAILNDHVDAGVATARWLENHDDRVRQWLDGVQSFAGERGYEAFQHAFGTKPAARDPLDLANSWLVQHKLPLGHVLSGAVNLLTLHAQRPLDALASALGRLLGGLTSTMVRVPPLMLLPLLVAGAYAIRRSLPFALFVLLALLLNINLGYWQATLETLSLVACATFISVAIGVPVGIAAAHRPWLHRLLQPLLDLMQTVPTFVYLIPALVLFGLGPVPGLIATVIFAVPAPIRLTHLGIRSVPTDLRDAGQAFGATPRQLLFKVELPYARPTIMAGVTQCIMLSLSMVVIAALVGADGLGKPVVRALNAVDISTGFEAGIAIVVLAIILDRLCKGQRPGH